jgi:hypothetical protein
MQRATLRGFADIELPNGSSLPARPMLDQDGRHVLRDGKAQYAPILRWPSRDLADRFSVALVELVQRAHPGALDGAGP